MRKTPNLMRYLYVHFIAMLDRAAFRAELDGVRLPAAKATFPDAQDFALLFTLLPLNPAVLLPEDSGLVRFQMAYLRVFRACRKAATSWHSCMEPPHLRKPRVYPERRVCTGH